MEHKAGKEVTQRRVALTRRRLERHGKKFFGRKKEGKKGKR